MFMRKFTFFLALMVAMVTTAFAQTPVLEFSAEQIGTYPYQLNEEDAAKVFALTDLTVAVKINTAGISGRRGLFVTSDPTQAKNTAAEGTASRYVAYGLNADNISYLASWRSGDRFSGGAKFTANSEVVCVYVINPTNGKCELYLNGALDRSWSGTNPNGFMSGYEIATPAMVKANHANANIYIGGGVSSEGADETFDGTIEGVKVYSGALSAAEIAAISFEDPVLLAEARAAFDAAQAAAQAILAEAELSVIENELPLQVTDATAAAYIWSNNPESSEGPIAQLVDGIAQDGNFFHTNWHGGGEEPHYIEVDLGEGNELAEFSFKYTTRFAVANDYPDAIQVMGSNDKEAYTELYNVTSGLPQTSGAQWASNIISSETAYRYLRFVVTAERIYWHMSEFDIITNEISVAEKYTAVASEVAALKNTCDAHAGNATYGIAKLNAAAAAINAIVEAINAGITEVPTPVPFEVVAVTPTEPVAELTTVTVEFSEEIEGTFDMMGMTQIYLGTRSNGCSFEVNGKVLTITPFNAINTPGEYKLVIPEGLITRKSNGEAVAMNGEYVFTVKEAVVEPETPSALNETVVFDFANNSWGIPTMEENNYSSIKTAGEYTDGVNTIKIDPTANKGSYIYDNKGFLNIGKTGSKIVLPAFDFAVEKIEVVGHSSATSYPNVDMNVYVGETAVSTACVGSTATSTFEIAADNQAAGNVYELVIGSNGGNYSSIMYITYIKVYPAENKLEAPAFDLASGVYVGEQTVTVHSATADLEGVTNVTYYYTTDGNEPTVEDEETTDGVITISESCTLKVIVELTYGDKTYVSASTSAEYIISEAVTYHRAIAVESGNYFLAANGHVAAPLANNVLPAVETTIDGNDLTEAAYYAITLEEAAEAGTYYIKDVNGNYIYTSSMYGASGPKLSSNGTYVPMSSWTITIADDENSTATIVSEGLTLVYDTAAGVFKVTDSVSSDMILPTFYGTQPTGIDGIYSDKLNGLNVNEGIYDLQGRKIENVTKGGIYIVNGKKVLVK